MSFCDAVGIHRKAVDSKKANKLAKGQKRSVSVAHVPKKKRKKRNENSRPDLFLVYL